MQRGVFKRKKKALSESALLSFKLGYINLMITLVPVLLSIAVFSRLAIVDLHLPRLGSGSQGAALQSGGPASSPLALVVAIQQEEVVVSNGERQLASFPRRNEKIDVAPLARFMQALKKSHPAENEVVILSLPQTAYEELIAVMDACRSAKIDGAIEILFSNVSLGEVS